MKLFSIVILSIFFLSCGQPRYRATAGTMMNTIMPDQEFTVKRTAAFNRNDVVLFEHNIPDWDNKENLEGPLIIGKKLFRMVAYSGDIIEIRNDSIFINNELLPFPPLCLLRYEIRTTVPFDEVKVENPRLAETGVINDTFIYNGNLTNQEVSDYSKEKGITSIRKITNPRVSNYGPLSIPAQGDTIEVNDTNFTLFQNIPGISLGTHILKEKLYFMLGDNRYYSEDSRFFGLVAQSKMYGVVK